LRAVTGTVRIWRGRCLQDCADSWTGEGFESFDVALKVLDDCSKKTEEATEQCVKKYFMEHKGRTMPTLIHHTKKDYLS
jgi:hypothetical protein